MKSILRILLLLSIFITANVNSSQASHLLGGEITWKCVNVGGIQKYKFTVVVYRDCTGCLGCLGATDELKVWNMNGVLSTTKNVGLLIDNDLIIHASGQVRIDKIDSKSFLETRSFFTFV